jgi:hypothetical protein
MYKVDDLMSKAKRSCAHRKVLKEDKQTLRSIDCATFVQLKEINHQIFVFADELYNIVAMYPPAVAFEKKLQKERIGRLFKLIIMYKARAFPFKNSCDQNKHIYHMCISCTCIDCHIVRNN